MTSPSRFPAPPDLPAVSEFAPGVVVNGWFAVASPTATPSGAVTRLNHEIAQYLNAPDIQQRLCSFGLAAEGAGTPVGIVARGCTTALICLNASQFRAPSFRYQLNTRDAASLCTA